MEPYTPLTLDEDYNESGAIQSVLSYLSEHGVDSENFVTKIAIPLLGSVFSSPWAFEQMLYNLRINDPILTESAKEWKSQAESECSLVNQALDEDPDIIKGRLLHAMDYIDVEISKMRRLYSI